MDRRFARLRSASPEMRETQMRAALHHFVSRNRRIKSAAQQTRQPPRGVRRQSAGAGDAPRINQNRSARDLDAARQFRIIQIDLYGAARRFEFVEERAADFAFKKHRIVREAFIAALRANGESGKRFGPNFIPRRFANLRNDVVAPSYLTKGLVAPIDRTRDGKMRNSKNLLQPAQGCFEFGGIFQLDQIAIARLRDPRNGDSFQCAAHRAPQLVQKKWPVPELQPKLVIVNDYVRRRVHFCLARAANLRSIPPVRQSAVCRAPATHTLDLCATKLAIRRNPPAQLKPP